MYRCSLIRETLLVHRESFQTRTGAARHDSTTVLVVEDDPVLSDMLAYNLSRDGFLVLRAAVGDRGIGLAREA